MLDVRSDIYSLGATLYHVLSGKHSAEDAREVEPLGADVCSPAVSAILQKAMAPDPEMRYQSAKEIRTAFLQLLQKDVRVLRRRKRKVAATAGFAGNPEKDRPFQCACPVSNTKGVDGRFGSL